jgi:hypothetical protein
MAALPVVAARAGAIAWEVLRWKTGASACRTRGKTAAPRTTPRRNYRIVQPYVTVTRSNQRLIDQKFSHA